MGDGYQPPSDLTIERLRARRRNTVHWPLLFLQRISGTNFCGWPTALKRQQ